MSRPRAVAPKAAQPGLLRLGGLALLGVAIVLVLNRFVVSTYRVPTPSMSPTLTCGDVVAVRRHVGSISRGTVVVLHPPAAFDERGRPHPDALAGTAYSDSGDMMSNPPTGPLLQQVHLRHGYPSRTPASMTFVKRVVAVGGDVVSVHDGHVVLGRTPLREPWLHADASLAEVADFGPFTVPRGMVFLVGDNRLDSVDSRQFGPVPKANLIGVAGARVWPPSRIGPLGADAPAGTGCGTP